MTEEERDKTVQFILDQQAAFAAQMQKIAEAQARHDEIFEKQDRLLVRQNEAIVGLTGIVGRLATSAEEHEKRLAGTEERLATLETNLTTLVERVDTFIVVVEKHIAGNGKKKKRRKA